GTVRMKSGSSAASFEQSSTAAGAMNFAAGIVSTELSGRSLPDTQWIGASKCGPVCSPTVKLFQYQAGPRPAYRGTSSRRNGAHCPNSGGSTMVGNSPDRVCVRSMTRMAPDEMALAKARRSGVVMVDHLSLRAELAFEGLRIARQPFANVAGYVADEA